MAGRWHFVLVAASALAFVGCTTLQSPNPSNVPTALASPAMTVLATASSTAQPSPTDAVALACAFGDPQRGICQKAAAAAQGALPTDHAPITAIQISNSGTLSICHFGDPAWTPSPSKPEDNIGCRAIADVTMNDVTVSMVLVYDYAADDWRLEFMRQRSSSAT